jgi:hypothetical protein
MRLPVVSVLGLLILVPGLMGAASTDPRGCRSEKDKLWGCVNDGRIYRDSLVAALDAADKVVISEHSDPLDLGPPVENVPAPSIVEYRRVELTPAQRAFFRKTLVKMKPETQSWYSACIPAVHHTIRFEKANGVRGTLRICFECSQVFWDGTEVSPPAAIHSALREILENAGLEPKRNWHKLALEARGGRTLAKP